MVLYRAYDIDVAVENRPDLSLEQINNIETVLNIVLRNLPGNTIHYQIPNERLEDLEHPIINYNRKIFNDEEIEINEIENELDLLADKLLFEEQVKESEETRRRNKKIRSGLLFVKHTEEKLILLKLELTTTMDKETFALNNNLSFEKQYYKIAVIEKNKYENIIVVDRNKVIAKYWAVGFLELERQRDSYVNTTKLIDYIENNSLINPDAGFSEEDYENLTNQVKEYIFINDKFDKEEIFSSLEFDKDKYETSSDDIFNNQIFDDIDADFDIDNDVLVRKYKKTIKVSNRMKIIFNDFPFDKRNELVEIDRNKLILTIENDYRAEIEEIFGVGNG